MSTAGVPVGVGTRFLYDGEVVEITEMHSSATGMQVILRSCRTRHVLCMAVRELLTGERARILVDRAGPSSDDPFDTPGVVLANMDRAERPAVLERAAHVREVLTGYRSGHAETAADGEPRAQYESDVPLMQRYEAKAAELGVATRTVRRWIGEFQRNGEAGLVESKRLVASTGRVDERWVQTAVEVMIEHRDQSKPSRSLVIDRTNARVIRRFGADAMALPSRATAFRVLGELEKRHPTFRLSTKRNRDIADRPGGVYGKLRPTRPGEYVLMDTTRLDVFALDPLTLQWLQAELTVAMDWYTRCITGLRITSVSTKSVDAAATLYQTYRPPPTMESWPTHAVWPEHGIPRTVLVDVDAIERPTLGRSGPAIVPETVVIDHGKIYVSEHLTSTCERLGVSIQPARLRTGRDKGPVERFFRTIREDLLQALPGYKGPDVHSRGLDVESEAFFYLDELEAIIREWVAVVYHHRPHGGLVDPGVPGCKLSPAMMFEHGVARAGYIEAPRDPDLAYEFLNIAWRTIQHCGIDFGCRRYNGPGLNPYREMTSPYGGKAKGRWPIHYNPDDITRIYFRDPETRQWHTLTWEHAPAMKMPMSEDALQFARTLAASKYRYPDDRLAVAELLERWDLGLGTTLAERRIALRLSREAAQLGVCVAGEPPVSSLPSVTKVLAATECRQSVEDGGDDSDAIEAGAQTADIGDDDDADFDPDNAGDWGSFYADALEDV
ncbi:integrase family protein [Mycobacteroides abscessus]|uniref:Mu transposase C-terminal domain-containing protein n=1 Tax=Mycobacteroides abscessus TaxID=36809 RepID=UPI0005E66062|nr:Mu transposase C-terminal domain-containing protein [Mycobacteroides abscessus]CPU39885.1 integrase family protein [Mycobacteroides abscessus]CPX59973.1 integrase family protein [Mycobacteroides abscessus]